MIKDDSYTVGDTVVQSSNNLHQHSTTAESRHQSRNAATSDTTDQERSLPTPTSLTEDALQEVEADGERVFNLIRWLQDPARPTVIGNDGQGCIHRSDGKGSNGA